MLVQLELDTETIKALIQLKSPGHKDLVKQLKAYQKAEHRLRNNLCRISSTANYIQGVNFQEENIDSKLRMIQTDATGLLTEEVNKYFFNVEDTKTKSSLSSLIHCCEFILSHGKFKRPSMILQINTHVDYLIERLNTRYENK